MTTNGSDGRESKCSFCDGRRTDGTRWIGATDIDDGGYSVVTITICPECRRDPEMVDAKLRKWAMRLRGQAAVLERFSPLSDV
jgi:hypothetical protein